MPVTAITLICNPAQPAIDPDFVESALNMLGAFGRVENAALSPGVAEDFIIAAAPPRSELYDALTSLIDDRPIDVVIQPANRRRKRLLVADMDSTIIGQECIDEIADFTGLKSEISAITERAMRGELNFDEALAERVAMLAGLPESALEETFEKRITLNPGARMLIATMNRLGATTVLVSGGFSYFVDRVAMLAGFQHYQANELMIENGALTGRVKTPILGREAKAAALRRFAGENAIPLEETLAVGDGANDLDMINAAGLGVAYHAKPKVAEAADAAIRYGDLTALLYAQGVARTAFVE